jgi:hypothetical protein
MIRVDQISAVPESINIDSLYGIVAEGQDGGIFAYVLPDEAPPIVNALRKFAGDTEEAIDTGEETYWWQFSWDEDNAHQFQDSIRKGELDVLLRDDQPIGYLLRANPHTLVLLQLLNGNE